MGSLDDELGAIFDAALADAHAHGPPARGGRRAAGRAHGAVRDDRARPVGRATGRTCRRSAGSSSSSSTREAVADGERIGVGEYVQAVAAARRGHGGACSRRWRRSSSIVSPVLTRPAVPLDAVPGRGRPRASAGAPTSSGTPTRCRSTSRASPRSRCPAAPRPAGCRSACRSPGRPGARRARVRARRGARAGAAPERDGRRRSGRRRGRRADRASGELSASELTRACLARIRERDGTHSHEGDPASVNAWVRVYEEEALAAAAQRRRRSAPRAGDPLPAAVRASRSASRICTRSRASR